MSEIDEDEILAAKKRLNFCDNSSMMQRLANPVSVYAQGKATKKGQKMRKKLYPFTGDSCSSSDLTQSLL